LDIISRYKGAEGKRDMAEFVKIEGLREVKRALRSLPDSTAKRIIRKISKKRLEPIAQRMRDRVPVHYGDLKKSIGVGTKLSQRQRRMHRKIDSSDVEVYAGAGPLPQAHLVEYGTSHQAAEPFARPAWDEGRHGLIVGLADDYWTEIKAAAARAAKKASKK
jgi:HK97 gp10 family phage protein